jgi:hypothetical protein
MGSFDSKNCRNQCGYRLCAFHIWRTAAALMPLALPSYPPTIVLSRPGYRSGSTQPTRSEISGASEAMRVGRVVVVQWAIHARGHESSRQRHTHAFDLLFWPVIAAMPTPLVDNKMTDARQIYFWAALRSPTARSRRSRSVGEISNRLPERKFLKATTPPRWAFQNGLLCQELSTGTSRIDQLQQKKAGLSTGLPYESLQKTTGLSQARK